MYLMFKHKNMLPWEFNQLSKEKKLLLNIFINNELDERLRYANESQSMPVYMV